MILDYRTIARRRKELGKLPEKLEDAYTSTISRIEHSPPHTADLGMKALMWLHLAFRPLTVIELQHALAVEPGDTQLAEDNIITAQVLLDCCLGLILIDQETGTVRFVHYTLQEYFKVHGIQHFPDGYTSAANVCLTYLDFNEWTQNAPIKYARLLRQFTFLKYAVCHWGDYVRDQLEKNYYNPLVLKVLRQSGDESHFAIQALYYHEKIYRMSQAVTASHCGIHVAAYFGLDRYMSVLGNEQTWDRKDIAGFTPLSWASQRGHGAVVRLLLTRDDVDVNSKDNDSRTPLSWAAEKGHKAVVRLLLARGDVDVDSKGNDSRTPLSWAAEKGHEAVVLLLLVRNDVDVDSKGNDGRSPLSWAAEKGHEAIVQLLLAQDDVDVDSKDNDSRTPLSWAGENGHDSIVRLLLTTLLLPTKDRQTTCSPRTHPESLAMKTKVVSKRTFRCGCR